jgi:hypothetical protein
MDTQDLKTARQQVAELEKTMLDDITAKAQLLGMKLVPIDDAPPPAPKQKRKRRTKQELEADRARTPSNEP